MASCCLRCGGQQPRSDNIAGRVSGSDPAAKRSEPNWFRRFFQKIFPGWFNGGSAPAPKIEAGNEELTTLPESARAIRIPDGQEDGVLKEEKSERNGGRSSKVQDPAAKTGNSVKPDHLLQNKKENSYQSSAGKSSGIHGAGDKKVDPKPPEASGSTIQDDKAKTSSSLIPGQTSQNNQESSYRIPAEKSSGSPGSGDKKVDPKLPETLGSTIQDAEAKTDSSFVPGHLFPNKQEINYASPADKSKGSSGAGERKMDPKLPETLGSSVLDARAKTGSSLVPGHILQNKLESSYGIPAEKSSGSPGVGDRKVDSKQPEGLGSSDHDSKEERLAAINQVTYCHTSKKTAMRTL